MFSGQHNLSAADFIEPNGQLTGRMTWFGAMAWAESLVYGGYNDWRLPIADTSVIACDYCIPGELGHLYYDEFDGVARDYWNSVQNTANFSLFSNVQFVPYFTANELGSITNWSHDWAWAFNVGGQGFASKGDAYWVAWAVRSGDVAAVPVPAAIWMFGSGLAGLGFTGRRRSSAA